MGKVMQSLGLQTPMKGVGQVRGRDWRGMRLVCLEDILIEIQRMTPEFHEGDPPGFVVESIVRTLEAGLARR